MASLFSGVGTVVGITTTTTPPATADAAGYAALTYVDIGCIESLGSFGGTATITNFTCLNDGIVQKIKGSRDNGDLEITVALDDTTAGWDAFNAAYEAITAGNYYFRVQYGNAQNATGEGAIRYFGAKVSSVTENVASADDVVTVTLTVAITTPIVKVDSTAGV